MSACLTAASIGGPLKGVERLADLAGLVRAEFEPGRLGLHIDLFTGREPAHDARQPYAGDLVGGLAQPGQVPDVAAADAEGDDDRDQQRDEAEHAGDGGLEQDGHGDRGDPLLVAVAGVLAHPLEVVEHLARRGVPALGVDRTRSGLRPAAITRSS